MNTKTKLTGAMLLLTSSAAFADVSHQIETTFGYESLSSIEAGGEDLTSQTDESTKMAAVSYSYFCSPIKNDNTPIELREFYQHPSHLNVVHWITDGEGEDRTDPTAAEKYDTAYDVLAFSGGLYLPSKTGFLATFAKGNGEYDSKQGVLDTSADGDVTIYELMVRQYIKRNAALHVQYSRSEVDWNYDWSYTAADGSAKSTRTLVLLGGQAVFGDLIGITMGLGKGDEVFEYSGLLALLPTTSYDLRQVSIELALFAGKRLSFFLAVDSSSSDQTDTLPGYAHEKSERDVALGAKYWLNERVGLGVKAFQSTREDTYAMPSTESTDTGKYKGLDVNVALRF